MRFVLFIIIICIGILPGTGMCLDLADYPELDEFILAMSEKHAFDQDELVLWFSETNIRHDIIETMNRPKEAAPWYEYREQFATPVNAKRGLKFWKGHTEALRRASETYGVTPEIILSILGVETQFGQNTGRFRVIDALTTLMLEYPKRSKFFQRELEEFLLLTRETNRDPLSLKGSYAGALGLPQFLPSTYRAYAVDFNNDNHKDIFTNGTDTIGSIANYLKTHGWQRNEPIVDNVGVTGKVQPWFKNFGIKPILRIEEFANYGLVPKRYTDTNRRAALIELEGESGPIYRFGFQNFYVITRYNKSVNYAMAVFELSKLIRDSWKIE